jgi:hypothetical protein
MNPGARPRHYLGRAEGEEASVLKDKVAHMMTASTLNISGGAVLD